MSPPNSEPPPPGLLSNVFGFFSREIESFVTNATGGQTAQEDDVSLTLSISTVLVVLNDGRSNSRSRVTPNLPHHA